MSNSSLKEQLQAMASQLSVKVSPEKAQKEQSSEAKSHTANHPAKPNTRPNHPPTARPHTQRPHVMTERAKKPLQKPKPKWLDYVQYGVELLKTYFPGAFKSANEVKPLKKGIKQELVLRLSTIDTIVTDDKACMVKSLAFYVNTAAYHKSVFEGAERIDLDGNPAGIVTAEEAKYSTERQQAKILAKQATTTPHLLKSKEEVTP